MKVREVVMSGPTRAALVVGATGSQGGAAVRALLRRGWKVRALTRAPGSAQARALASIGAEVVRGDLGDAPSLSAALRGIDGAFLVTDWMAAGIAREIAWGAAFADAAAQSGLPHLVFASAFGARTHSGVPHFDSKRAVVEALAARRVPTTVLRPGIFMEDLTDRKYVPPASWGMMPRLVGPDVPVPWVSVDDIGEMVAVALDAPEQLVGRDLPVIGDFLSISAAREIFREVRGRKPFALPMPERMFRRFVSDELATMWCWLARADLEDASATRAILPKVMDMRRWLLQKSGQRADARA